MNNEIIYKYVLYCSFCGKEVLRKYKLKKAVCGGCKYRNFKYKKKGFRTKKIRNMLIILLRKRGFTYKRIGKIFGISKTRVGQIVRRYKERQNE